MNNKEEHLDSYIENLPNSCANTLVNKEVPCNSPSRIDAPLASRIDAPLASQIDAPLASQIDAPLASRPSPVEFKTITCPELSQIELNNFCFYNSKCILVCPKNVNLNKNLVPSENNSSIIDTFIGDFKIFNPKKKIY
jgi:hypothetical protein